MIEKHLTILLFCWEQEIKSLSPSVFITYIIHLQWQLNASSSSPPLTVRASIKEEEKRTLSIKLIKQ